MNQYKIKVSKLLDIANKRRLYPQEEQELKSIDTNITNTMLKEKSITNHQHTYHWLPELHEAVTSVFI